MTSIKGSLEPTSNKIVTGLFFAVSVVVYYGRNLIFDYMVIRDTDWECNQFC